MPKPAGELGIFCAAHHRSEALPTLSFEPHYLELLDRSEVIGSRFDPSAREIDADFEVEAGCLLHNVLTCEIVAALPEHLFQPLGNAVSEHGRRIIKIALGIPLAHERSPLGHGGVILPLSVLRVF